VRSVRDTLRRLRAAVRTPIARVSKPRRWPGGQATAVVVVGALAAAVVFEGTVLVRRIREHPYFALTEIVIAPTRHVRAGALLEASGLNPGISLWTVDPAAVAARLEANPWIYRASVRREFPRRLVVRLVERRPSAILLLDVPLYVDQTGVAFAPLGERDPLDLPLVTGIEAAIQRGETVYARHGIRRAIRLVELMADAGLPFRVSEVHIDREVGITVFPVSPPVALTFGWGGFPAKMVRLSEVLDALAGREAQIGEIDLTLKGQVVIRLRRGGRGVGRAREARGKSGRSVASVPAA